MRKVVFIRKRLQQKAAEILRRKTEGLSYKTKLIILIVFCISGCCCFTYTILKSLFIGRVHLLTVTAVKKPAYIFPLKEDFGDKAFISEKEYQRLQGIKHYMDSLKKSRKDKRLYDSIISKNPALMDNIKMIERLYQMQTKK